MTNCPRKNMVNLVPSLTYQGQNCHDYRSRFRTKSRLLIRITPGPSLCDPCNIELFFYLHFYINIKMSFIKNRGGYRIFPVGRHNSTREKIEIWPPPGKTQGRGQAPEGGGAKIPFFGIEYVFMLMYGIL